MIYPVTTVITFSRLMIMIVTLSTTYLTPCTISPLAQTLPSCMYRILLSVIRTSRTYPIHLSLTIPQRSLTPPYISPITILDASIDHNTHKLSDHSACIATVKLMPMSKHDRILNTKTPPKLPPESSPHTGTTANITVRSSLQYFVTMLIVI